MTGVQTCALPICEGGVIINMSSVNAHLGLDAQVVYTTSKGGVQQLTKVQAVALAPHNIKVNAMAPGPIETELMRRVGSDQQLMYTILSRTPQGRIGTPRECRLTVSAGSLIPWKYSELTSAMNNLQRLSKCCEK